MINIKWKSRGQRNWYFLARKFKFEECCIKCHFIWTRFIKLFQRLFVSLQKMFIKEEIELLVIFKMWLTFHVRLQLIWKEIHEFLQVIPWDNKMPNIPVPPLNFTVIWFENFKCFWVDNLNHKELTCCHGSNSSPAE